MKNMSIVGLCIFLIIFLCSAVLASLGLYLDKAEEKNIPLALGVLGLLSAGFMSVAFGTLYNIGTIAYPDEVLKTFGVYETLGSVKINEDQFAVIIKAQNGSIKACKMDKAPPKVFKVVKNEKGERYYQTYPAPQNFSVST